MMKSRERVNARMESAFLGHSFNFGLKTGGQTSTPNGFTSQDEFF